MAPSYLPWIWSGIFCITVTVVSAMLVSFAKQDQRSWREISDHTVEREKAREAGFFARLADKPIIANPYGSCNLVGRYDDQRCAWEQSWLMADRQLLKATCSDEIEPRELIFADIEDERDRQDMKWRRSRDGWKHDPAVKLLVLMEEVGECAKAVLEGNKPELKTELVQVAAVCVAHLESLEHDTIVNHQG